MGIWHPYTPDPHLGIKRHLVKAEGSYVWDSTGHRVFDGTSSWWCNLHGHCHPRLIRALEVQARQMDHVMLAPHTHPTAVELAEALLKRLPQNFEKVFFSDNGSTAVETALKMTLQYWKEKGCPERKHFLSIARSYHGDTLGAVSVGQIPLYHGQFGSDKAFKVEWSYPYRSKSAADWIYCVENAVLSMERVLEEHGSNIAAFIVEPLLVGAGGMIPYPSQLLEKWVKRVRALGTLVIFDEVFTGFGRTGTMFALEQAEEWPDIICLSKGLTSGMLPLAVTATTGTVYDGFLGGSEHAFYHGHTFTGNALGCAVALESLRLFDEEGVLQKNKALSQVLEESVRKFEGLECVADVRHKGMVWACELKCENNGPGWKIARDLWNEGYWIRPLGNVLYLVPPYSATPDDLNGFFNVLYSRLTKESYFA